MLRKNKVKIVLAVFMATVTAAGSIAVRAAKIERQAANEASNHSTVLEEALMKARINILDMDAKQKKFDEQIQVAIEALPTPTPEPTPEPTPVQVAEQTTERTSRGGSTQSDSSDNNIASGSGSYYGSGDVSAVVELALQYNGASYVMGGESPSGFDCSGFVKYIYATAAGISLPHSAEAQSEYGIAVSQGELQPGDLVFFQTYTSGISHVGIYIGNNQFIHAANSRSGVKINALGSSGYENYRGAVRILQ